MFERKITGRLNNIYKKELLTFFNQANGKSYKEIRNVSRFYGLANSNDTYEQLRELYNTEVDRRRNEGRVAEKDFYKRNVTKISIKNFKKIENVNEEGLASKNTDLIGHIYNIFNSMRGKTVIFQYVVDRRYVLNVTLDIPTTKFGEFWKEFTKCTIMVESGVTVFDANDFKGNVLIFEARNDIKVNKVKQYFRDGINHCVFHPIKKWAEEKVEKAESTRTKERYSKIVDDCTKLTEEYVDGVPEDAFPNICNILQMNIEIQLPFMKTSFLKFNSEKKPLTTFKFLNTRIDHLETNMNANINKIINVTTEELYKIKDELDKNNEFYTFKRGRYNLYEISTLFHTYKTTTEYNKISKDFEISTGLINCKIDDIGDMDLSEFIREGVHYNETVDFKDYTNYINCYTPEKDYYDFENNVWKKTKPLSLKHIDMTKAYAAFKTCKWYGGFVGKITDYRNTDRVVSEGLYRITDLDFRKSKFKIWNDKLKVFVNNNVYTSAELRFLDSVKVKYRVVSGCWGIEPFHFEFNEDMINKKIELSSNDGEINKVGYYAYWTGACDQHKLKQKFWMNGNDDYVNVLKSQEYAKIKQFDLEESKEVCIEFNKESNLHLSHITAFITAYQRLNVFEQLLTMDYDSIIRICVDGIYYFGEDVECCNVFRIKNDKMKFGNAACPAYVSNVTEKPLIILDKEFRENYRKELHLGGGGCGKTWYNLNDRGLVKPLFVAPSWKLARNKQIETGIYATVWAKIITTDPEQINRIKYYNNVLIIDEISMMTEREKLFIMETYKDMKIIMCGDLGYQLPYITKYDKNKKVIPNKECTLEGFDIVKQYTDDHRCKCVVLREVKKKLRDYIKKKTDMIYVKKYIKSKIESISVEKLKEEYKIEDMILAKYNKVKDNYTEMFSGKFDREKYYVCTNTSTYSNGEIVISDKELPNLKLGKNKNRRNEFDYEVRHCFTVHSIQGETAEYNLYIDLKGFDSIRMLYTAISRARTINQIKFIE